ncbi:MAG: BMP family ABC transporter substrate-binding protein [Microthrixaceae bacterium]
MGAAAAMKTESDKLGFIGGVETDLIKKFEAGYVAGAKKINPDIEVDVQYITQPPDFSGFDDPAKAKTIAKSMYDGGADVVFHAARCLRQRALRGRGRGQRRRGHHQVGDRRGLGPVQPGARGPAGRHPHLNAEAGGRGRAGCDHRLRRRQQGGRRHVVRP